MSNARICEGCPNQGTLQCEIAGRPFDSATGYAVLADTQGGMSEVLDLTGTDNPSQVTGDALVRRVENCEGPQVVNQEKGLLRRVGERLSIVKPEKLCPALGHLAVSDREVPLSAMEKLRTDSSRLRSFGAFMRGVERNNMIRRLK